MHSEVNVMPSMSWRSWLVLASVLFCVAPAIARLAAPVAIEPVGVIEDATPTYCWSQVSGATWYQLWVNDSTGTVVNRWYMASQVDSTNGECSITPAESIASGSATWWVRAWSPGNGNGDWSPGMEFSFGIVLVSPTPISPIGNVPTASPTYRWAVVPEATLYQLWVEDSTGVRVNRWYTSSQVNAASGECSITPAETLVGGDATWWIRAWSPATGAGPWSDPANFHYLSFEWATVLEPSPDPEVVTDSALFDAIVATGLPWRLRDNASQIELLLVPAGTFTMGCSPSERFDCADDENPLHEVTISQPFYLGRYEVTQAEWTAVMGFNPSGFRGSEESQMRPVDSVSWNAIQLFEGMTGLRLPTEAEWEYACRAGTDTAFNNGSDDDATLVSLGWFRSNAAGRTRPVGGRLANALGFHDMHGNVWEWCEDWFDSDYYAESPEVDPSGATSGFGRVLRGGSWLANSGACRSSARSFSVPGHGSRFGFRVARNP